ncbi:carboxymuconolactone decarboxylase family protein [Pseudonocardia kujensis]|uniref:carboxymuconolactone decarboxylase family protein n=1 Tax=Pseudonocardia kujensis TaxID=1128675 RepID=UPI001E292313|nr:carboxymuconolactone decarboxylase family protein [Pseudonocardia kujensis]MCE0764074.1 carboxymuconolactone decarboxylase family protein [Pseudonocardia kujensis]
MYDQILAARTGSNSPGFPVTDNDGSLLGPFNAMLLAPRIGGRLQALGDAVRRGELTAREREIVVLTVATHWKSEFEWRAHELSGAAAGLSETELTALREGRDLDLTDRREAAVSRLAGTLLAQGALSDEAYGEAVDMIGPEHLFEVVTLVGYYGLIALQLSVFGVR